MASKEVMPAGDPVPVPSLIPPFDDEELVLQRKLENPGPKTWEEAVKKYIKNVTIKNARLCLEQDNKNKGVEYVLDIPLNTCAFFSGQTSILHSNFTAKNKDGESELFFAESKHKDDSIGLDLITCCIIHPHDIDDPAKVRKGCIACPNNYNPPIIYHPVGLHKHGVPRSKEEAA